MNIFVGYAGVVVDDGSALNVLTGASEPDVAAATAVLRAGGAVVREGRYVQDGKVTFEIFEQDLEIVEQDTDGDNQTVDVKPGEERTRKVSVPAYVLSSGASGVPPIISPAALAKAGLAAASNRLVASTLRVPTQAEEDQLRERLNESRVGLSITRQRSVEFPVEVLLLLGAAGLITLAATAIGTGLAAADGRADLSTLASVGASPRMRRGLSISQAGVIAGLGSVLGAMAGLGAAIAVLVAINRGYESVWPGPEPFPITIPWLNLGAALLVVPIVAILGAGLLTRSRLPIERRL